MTHPPSWDFELIIQDRSPPRRLSLPDTACHRDWRQFRRRSDKPLQTAAHYGTEFHSERNSTPLTRHEKAAYALTKTIIKKYRQRDRPMIDSMDRWEIPSLGLDKL